MAPTTGTGHPYAAAIGELWPQVARTLSRLEAIAADPQTLERDNAAELLARSQYNLHLGSEHVYGLAPPPGSETAHAELAAALAGARDATAEIAEAASWEALVHEWRGALFRVRLARIRLATPMAVAAPAPEPEVPPGIGPPLVAFLLALGGALTLVAGATLDLWPLWAAGVVSVAVSVLAYRP